ncbi:MAG: YfcE family phosphodiesterase [Campylobacteraceae bacterium]|nr:YfcE family phosphodiesterase [Campylobacteraceae bacterium]
MLKVGLISDSHQRSDVTRSAVDYLLKKEIDLLLHAGDIMEFETLECMKNSSVPYVAVLGNHDTHLREFMSEFELFSEPHHFEFEGFNFKLMHHPFYLNSSSDIIIYGHTHRFVAKFYENSLYINSGEICARNKALHEFAYFTCQKDGKTNKFEVFKVECERESKASDSQIAKFNWKESRVNL